MYRSYARIDWKKFSTKQIDGFLAELGYSLNDRLTTNPIVDLLRSNPGNFVSLAERYFPGRGGGINRTQVVLATALCQTNVYDNTGGPEGDNKPKALRRLWYHYFKQFSQLFSQALYNAYGTDMTKNSQNVLEMDDLAWTGRLSECYGNLVDNGATYLQLWVEDASRMMTKGSPYRLFDGLNIMLCVEKDSLFSDFEGVAKTIGAALISGKGKNSKAAAEKALREQFGWSEDRQPFSPRNPLFVLHISDHDFDGEAVIGPTFGEQMRRYTPDIIEARVGVRPDMVAEKVSDPWLSSYQIKIINKGYEAWATEKAIWKSTCVSCGAETYSIGLESDGETGKDSCSNCGGALVAVKSVEPHGFEVEALKSSDYREAVARRLLEVIDFESILHNLRTECVADRYNATDAITAKVLETNELYKRLQKARRLCDEAIEALKTSITEKVEEKISTELEDNEDLKDRLFNLEDDPEQTDFINYVVNQGGSSWASPWRPFDEGKRTNLLTEEIQDDSYFMETLEALEVEDYEAVKQSIINAL